jgi:hypothetical protein
MADSTKPWVGMSQPNTGGRPPKHDYDDDEFYDQVFYYAFNGANNSEIATMLDLNPDVFGKMVAGNYQPWNEEENERRSKRLSRVLASAREKINMTVRSKYMQSALGKSKAKSKVIRYIKDDEENTLEVVQETETQLAPNMQALSMWLLHHDPEWRKVQRGFEPSEAAAVTPDNIERGIAIEDWINDHMEYSGKKVKKEDLAEDE